ncbi:hypothetical protein CVT24_005398 [Panaeolus cyanescens]|uniref:Cytochrome P450 n=1 Tax=Panaeolus cyanescens TaxID=181874 RepID=A0A409Y924_9AGAR|nr:hypothetical protein CVT24_005398 [Panaeolus cyanescens]
MNWTFNVGLMPYGPWWRRHRKVFHDHFSPSVISKYDNVQLRNARSFLGQLLETPDDFLHHIHHVFASVIMEVVYGVKIRDSKDDPYVAAMQDSIDDISVAGVPGSFMVDFLPWLKYVPAWFPGASFQKVAARARERTHRLVVTPFNEVKAAVKAGTAQPSVVMSIINELVDDSSREEEERVAQNVAAVAYVAGADTTASAVQAFFLAMALHPDAQKKAQAELDAVVGPGRLPDFSDLPSLPYLDALMKETLRWHQVVPFGVAHTTSEDDEYNGYFIPKGTVVMGNAWSMMNDPTVFEAPSVFNPDRYLKNPELRSPYEAFFGYGRRMCPGRFFSDRNLFALSSSVLSVFDILPPVDANGNPMKLEYEPMTGFVSFPSPYSCRIVPRSLAAKKLILDAQIQA